MATAAEGGQIEIWGDGEQTRSFCYVDDCVEGIHRIMRSDHRDPLNLGTEEVVSINELARIVIDLSGKRGLTLRHVPGPEGVRGRNSDNRRLRDVLGWEPSVALRDGLGPTYGWIAEQVRRRYARPANSSQCRIASDRRRSDRTSSRVVPGTP